MPHPGFKIFEDNYSRGCQLCQQGKWICIYLTYLCNAQCHFCPAPYKQVDKIVSDFGNDKDTIYHYLEKYNFSGISFSGGDCFLVFDRLLHWLSFFKQRNPHIYFWVYTNGLAVDEQKLRKLADAGLDEIRFNIAASGYNNPLVLEQLSNATKLIANVAVEIPSIPDNCSKLLSVLPFLNEIKVKYLHLHEYLLMPDDPSYKTKNKNTFLFNKEASLVYHTQSLKNTEKIKQYCSANNLSIKVNNCSLYKKEVQMLYRRLMMGKIFKKQYDLLSQDGMLEHYFTFPNKLTVDEIKKLFQKNTQTGIEKHFVHPNEITNIRDMHTIARLSFLPPLRINENRKLLNVEICDSKSIIK